MDQIQKKILEKPFNPQDLQIMREHIRQRSMVILSAGIIFYMVFFAAIILIESTLWDLIVTIVAQMIFFIFCWNYLHDLAVDRRNKTKISYMLQVEEKYDSTRYAWHQTLAWSSLRLIEYYFKSGGRQYLVDEAFYQKLESGDWVLLSYAPKSGLLLSMQIEEK